MTIGIIGAGRMGSGIARKLHDNELDVWLWNRTIEKTQELKKELPRINIIQEVSEFSNLSSPRIIWLMLPQGGPTEEMLSELDAFIGSGDVVVDGGNAHYKDTERRFKKYKNSGINFLGIGVSGGVHGEKNGYSLMAGGSRDGYEILKPILDALSSPQGSYDYLGEGGAGHFVKMVHNGIEYGMMQSIGEGFEIIQKSQYSFDLKKVVKVWKKGSIISSFLIDRASDQLEKDSSLSEFSGPIARGGEGDWTIEAAKEEGVGTDVIEKAVEFREKSEKDKKIQDSFTAKVINALRQAFGGHQIAKK